MTPRLERCADLRHAEFTAVVEVSVLDMLLKIFEKRYCSYGYRKERNYQKFGEITEKLKIFLQNIESCMVGLASSCAISIEELPTSGYGWLPLGYQSCHAGQLIQG